MFGCHILQPMEIESALCVNFSTVPGCHNLAPHNEFSGLGKGLRVNGVG
jgi:hypothetical protein